MFEVSMILLIWISSAFLLLQVAVTVYNFISKPLLKKKQQDHSSAFVSVLIPARNEERNIGNLLSALSLQQYDDFEIIVLDDNSNDHTAEIVIEQSNHNNRIRLIKGTTLSQHWLGKNWACHQLALEAKGDYFLFLDADVNPHPNLIASLIGEAAEKKLTLLSVFPDQQMETIGESCVVPLMNYILLSLLPLKFIFSKGNVSFSAANGQCMFFNARDYRENLFHQQVKEKVAEDIEIMKIVKTKSRAGETLLANGLISCRMYSSGNEAILGFRKNILSIFGNSIFFLLTFLLLSVFAYIPIIMFATAPVILLMLCGVLLIRILISVISNQSSFKNIILHPLQMLMLVFISVLALISKSNKNATWKGRRIKI